MQRARITTDEHFPNRCTLKAEDEYGDVRERDFFAPPGGGSVRENWSNPRDVCAGLMGGGWVLEWNPEKHPKLADLIRRERRRTLAADRKMWR